MADEKLGTHIDIDSNSSTGKEEVLSHEEISHVDDDNHHQPRHHTEDEIEALGKWYDKKRFGLRYSDAMIQVVMCAFVIFLTPGMFNALSGIGASISDVATSDNAMVALYSTFATVGFFGGTICNTIGIRASLVFGGIGYCIYSGSLLCFYHTQNKGFVIFAGAFLGICASVLWAAQGTIIMSYPTEGTKGRALMVFWVIFNLGAVIGSIIPLADNIHNRGSTANDGTYIAFIVLMFFGSVVACFMLPMSRVWKADGTRVTAQKHPNWWLELKGLFLLLIKEPIVVLMFPMFLSSNWFYTYQFNDFNAGRFDLPTRSLNSLLYWLSQMIGAVLFGFILDMPWVKRSTRAKIGWGVVFVLGMVIWGGGYKFQDFTRADVTVPDDAPKGTEPLLSPINYKQGRYIGPMFLYMFYGGFDAIYQTFILWVLGALSNNPKKTALYAGFFKGLQSAGAAIAWRLDALHHPYMTMFATSWGLSIGSMVIAIPLIFFRIKDTTDFDDDGMADLVGQDELEPKFSTQVSHIDDSNKV